MRNDDEEFVVVAVDTSAEEASAVSISSKSGNDGIMPPFAYWHWIGCWLVDGILGEDADADDDDDDGSMACSCGGSWSAS